MIKMATGRANITPHTINLYHCNNVQIGTSNIINYHESHSRDRRGADVISNLEEDGFQASISPFNTIQSPAHFVGRQSEIQCIKNFLRKKQHKRILQIYGPSMTGKKALAKRAISSINEEPSPWTHPTILIPCTRVTSWRDFLSTFASFCKINIVFENLTERSYIVSFKDKVDKMRPVVLFTNCEKLKLTTPSCSKNFCDFISDLLDNCRFSKFILTSQQYFELNGNSENIQLSKLSEIDSLALFEEMLPDIDNEIYSEVILDRCYGLPTYIRDAAFLVQDNTNVNPLTCDELRNLLEDEARTFRLRDAHTSTTNMALAEYIPCIPPELHQDTLDLTILNGTFGLEAIQAVLGKSSGEAKHAVGVLCKNSVLNRVSNGTGGDTVYAFKPEIAAILTTVVKYHVPYSDVARLRFIKYFGEILLKVNSALYLPSQQAIHGYDRKDWLHLETLLREAVHCSGETFEPFKRVALKADNIIINCFPRTSIEFYQTLTKEAERMGSPIDVAALKAQLGRALTVNRGTDMKGARKLFQEAAEVLQKEGPSCALIGLKRDLAFNCFRDALYKEAARNCEEAVELARKVDTLDHMTISRLLSAKSLVAINYNIIGDHLKAQDILLKTLELAKDFSSSHASIYVMLNTLGIISEKKLKDDDQALKFYTQSLKERRKYQDFVPQELIVPLNNIGMLYSKRNQNEKGLKYLEEALEICMKCKLSDDKAGLTYMHLGCVNLKMNNFETALEQLQRSVEIYTKCCSEQRVHIPLRLYISHCHILTDEVDKAKETLQECFKYSLSLRDQVPEYDHYLVAIGHLIPLVQSSKQLYEKTLEEFIEESKRLLRLWDVTDERVECTEELLSSAEESLRNFQYNNVTEVTDFLKIKEFCFACKLIANSNIDIDKHWENAAGKSAHSAEFNSRLLSF